MGQKGLMSNTLLRSRCDFQVSKTLMIRDRLEIAGWNESSDGHFVKLRGCARLHLIFETIINLLPSLYMKTDVNLNSYHDFLTPKSWCGFQKLVAFRTSDCEKGFSQTDQPA